MITRPLYLDKICPFIGKPIIKVVTGIRRCGKSTILKLVEAELRERGGGVPEERIVTINLELFANRHLKDAEHFYEYIKERVVECGSENEICYLFFDEIQEVEGWEQLITGIQLEYKITFLGVCKKYLVCLLH